MRLRVSGLSYVGAIRRPFYAYVNVDMFLWCDTTPSTKKGPMLIYLRRGDAFLKRLGDIVTLARCGHQRPGRFAIAYGDDLQPFG